MRPWLLSSGGFKHGPEKTINGCNDGRQVRKIGPSRTSNECGPLNLFLSIVSEFAGQGERTLGGDLNSPARERRLKCKPHRFAVEASSFSQAVDIEEVFHSTVRQCESHHRLGFLRYRGFGPVRAESCTREIEKARLVEHFRRRYDSITGADINL